MITEKMFQAASPLLRKIYQHPFNLQMASGKLPTKTFQYYLEQDALYLVGFSKALKIIANRLTDANHQRQFLQFANDTLVSERKLHEKYQLRYGNARFFPYSRMPIKKDHACHSYVEHLLTMAAQEPAAISVASVLPCFWVYNQLGKHLASQKNNLDNPYHEWIASYSSAGFAKSVASMVHIAEKLGDEAEPSIQTKMISSFMKSVDYELLFWDGAYHKTPSKIKTASVSSSPRSTQLQPAACL